MAGALATIFTAAALSAVGVTASAATAVATGKSGKSKPPAVRKILPPKYYKLAFSTSFSGNTLDTKTWDTCYPWASPSGCTNFGNKSDPEKEWYQPGQIKVENGALALTAARIPTSGYNQWGQPTQYACRSGMVTTFPGLDWEYGFLQITARVPFGKGLWSAFWLAPANWAWPPEVDILEHWGSEAASKVYLHPVGLPEQRGQRLLADANAGWHTFTLKWTRTQLIWYFDGYQVYATTTGIPHQAMYLIANLAVDDDSPGGCDGTLLVKSVRLWRP